MKFITFVVELILVAVVVGWYLLRAPDAFDPWIPWVVTAIVLHMIYRFVWETDAVKSWRFRSFDTTRGWGLFTLVGIIICIPTWFLVKYQVKQILIASHQPHSVDAEPTTTIIQNSDGTCTNVVGGNDVKVDCPK